FPVDEYDGRDLFFVAIGTAIAPVRAAVEHALERRSRFGRIAMLYGARTPDNFAFAGDYDRWREAGVLVELTVTRAGEAWLGPRGRVQELLGDMLGAL